MLKQLQDEWFAVLKEAEVTDPQGSFRTGLLKLAYPYARLVALSYGFQHAFGKNHTDENPFLMRVCSFISVPRPGMKDIPFIVFTCGV